MIEAGNVIGGRYRLDHLLGEGGMGAVWAATHTLTNKRVAIKLLKVEVASADTLRRFVREARAASAVRHPNVVEVHDILTLDDGSPAMVMDFLEGETLAQRLARTGPIPLTELCTILTPVFSAVGGAHAVGIIHRDLKPDNILLARLGDGRTEAMVLDFGIAKILPFTEEMKGESALTHSKAMLGTPYYMAPEQAFGEKDLDARADVWALGVILYECASGEKPIQGDTLGQVFKMITTGSIVPLQQLQPGLPAEFVALVGRMMSRDREQRPRDLREPFELLRRWSGGGSTGASIPPPRSSLPFDATVPSRPNETPQPAPVVQAAQGLGASAVPVTSGVGLPGRTRLAPLVIVGGAAAALGALLGLAALLRDPTDSPGPAAAASSLAAATSAVAVEAAPAPIPSASSASPVSEPAPSGSSAVPAKPPGAAKPAASSSRAPVRPARRLLPGGVEQSVPF